MKWVAGEEEGTAKCTKPTQESGWETEQQKASHSSRIFEK